MNANEISSQSWLSDPNIQSEYNRMTPRTRGPMTLEYGSLNDLTTFTIDGIKPSLKRSFDVMASSNNDKNNHVDLDSDYIFDNFSNFGTKLQRVATPTAITDSRHCPSSTDADNTSYSGSVGAISEMSEIYHSPLSNASMCSLNSPIQDISTYANNGNTIGMISTSNVPLQLHKQQYIKEENASLNSPLPINRLGMFTNDDPNSPIANSNFIVANPGPLQLDANYNYNSNFGINMNDPALMMSDNDQLQLDLSGNNSYGQPHISSHANINYNNACSWSTPQTESPSNQNFSISTSTTSIPDGFPLTPTTPNSFDSAGTNGAIFYNGVINDGDDYNGMLRSLQLPESYFSGFNNNLVPFSSPLAADTRFKVRSVSNPTIFLRSQGDIMGLNYHDQQQYDISFNNGFNNSTIVRSNTVPQLIPKLPIREPFCWIKLSSMDSIRIQKIQELAKEKSIKEDIVSTVLEIMNQQDSEKICKKVGVRTCVKVKDGELFIQVKTSYPDDTSYSFIDENNDNKDDEVDGDHGETSLNEEQRKGSDFQDLMEFYKKRAIKHKSKGPNYVKRPLNSFMLYRKVQTQAANAYTLAQAILHGHMEGREKEIELQKALHNQDYSSSISNSTMNPLSNSMGTSSVRRRRSSMKMKHEPIINATNNSVYKKINHQNISQVIGLMWQTEDKSVQEMFKRFANKEKQVHKALYPDYKYCPQKKQRKI